MGRQFSKRLAVGASAVTLALAVGLFAATRSSSSQPRLGDVNQSEVNLLKSLPVLGMPYQYRRHFVSPTGVALRNVQVRCDWKFGNGDKLCKVSRLGDPVVMRVRYRGLSDGSFLARVLRRSHA